MTHKPISERKCRWIKSDDDYLLLYDGSIFAPLAKVLVRPTHIAAYVVGARQEFDTGEEDAAFAWVESCVKRSSLVPATEFVRYKPPAPTLQEYLRERGYTLATSLDEKAWIYASAMEEPHRGSVSCLYSIRKVAEILAEYFSTYPDAEPKLRQQWLGGA